ncbi:MAG: protein of unknown function DUF323, partial [Magnetococcales bacterium]|nr:protein of unknown function DUF323 [Magnetococcales bacterium]
MFDWLASEGWDDVFLDKNLNRGLYTAAQWEVVLEKAVQDCEVFLLLLSREWEDSTGCQIEWKSAKRFNKLPFVVLIEDCSLPDALKSVGETWQYTSVYNGQNFKEFPVSPPDGKPEKNIRFSEEGLTQLKHGLKKAGLDPHYFPWPPKNDPNRSPFRGMRPLEGEDAGIFFGREAFIADFLAKLQLEKPSRFHVILGASGSGKSSFLRAGILPRLHRNDRHFLPLPIIRPKKKVLTGTGGLLDCLDQAFRDRKMGASRPELQKAMADGCDALKPWLTRLAEKAKPPPFGDENIKTPALVLAIDQGEELFFTERDEETKDAEDFISLLKGLVLADDPVVIVIFTIRTDAYKKLQNHKTLVGAIDQDLFSLPFIPRGMFQSIIEGPVNLLANTDRPLTVEPQLIQKLLADVDEGGGKDALPLLAFTLERLFLDYGGTGSLRLQYYTQMNGVEGVINAAVERAMEAADQISSLPRGRDERLALMRRGLIPSLASMDPETQMLRRRVAKWDEIFEQSRPLLDLLVEQRLLVTDVVEGKKTIEPAHESLLWQWKLLKEWLQEESVNLAILEGVKHSAREWEVHKRNPDWLVHNAGRLEDAEEITKRDDFASSFGDFSAYLQACQSLEYERRNGELIQEKQKLEVQTRIGDYAEAARKRAESLVNFMLFDLRDKLKPLGRLDILEMAAIRVLDYFNNFSNSENMSLDHQRSVLVGKSNLGDILTSLGNLPAAMTVYLEGMEIAKRLSELDPKNAEWQRDLRVSHNKTGDILQAQGDNEKALAAYRAGMEITKSLSEL